MSKAFIQRIVFAVMMSFILSLLMSGWVTGINLGLQPNFLAEWGKAFLLAWPAAASIAFLFGPKVQTMSCFFVKKIITFESTRK